MGMNENKDYKEQIRQLVELQRVDDQIFAVRQKMENAPRDLGDLEQKFNVVDGRRNHILDKISHLRDQYKRISNEMDDGASNMKKSKNKLAQVQNTKEYQAMLREMDSMEKLNRTKEEERITLQEELRSQEVALEEIDKDYNSLKEQMEEKRSTLDERLLAANEEIAVLNKKRDQAKEFIPFSIFSRYEFIRERMEHPVIVDVEDGICSGCNIAIPPQDFIKLQEAPELGGMREILSCPNCQRLIYWSQHYDDPLRPVKAVKPKVELDDDEPDEDEELEEVEIEEQGEDIENPDENEEES